MTDLSPVSRPVLRWYGGKWLLAPWIIEQLPPHRTYVEPFGGAASVLLRKPRAYAEIYNDLEDQVVTLFRVLRDERMSARLIDQLRLTPFSRTDFRAAYRRSRSPVETARRLIIRAFMGFGSDGARIDLSTGFRASSNRHSTTPAHDWASYPVALAEIVGRLQGVVVENRADIACMRQHDGSDTLHYVDPPYMPVTRKICHRRHGYLHELTDADHEQLLADLQQLRGMVVLSGYPHPLYDAALDGWERVERTTYADGARPRVECLWLNPAAQRGRQQQTLFRTLAD